MRSIDHRHASPTTRALRERVASARELPRNGINPVTATLAGVAFFLTLLVIALNLQS